MRSKPPVPENSETGRCVLHARLRVERVEGVSTTSNSAQYGGRVAVVVLVRLLANIIVSPRFTEADYPS
jgi:hypothetical protein